MDPRRAAGAAGALLALAACFAYTAAAPTTSDHTALDLYDGPSEGCYYNFQHYGEGDRIMTNEPCLNCTCHNRMLMCYLRVCPFTKPIGQDCTIEKRADQCCPIVTCPDVPVDLLTSTSTSSPAEYGATGLGKIDKYGCSINGRYFSEGSKVPSTPNKPCEHCYCIRNMTTCVMQECTLHVDGCTPIYHKDVCCPVRYSCDHPEDEIPLLDDMTTTVRPTPGFILTTTTLSPVTQMTQDCVHDDHIFSDGALIKTEKACEHCYCMKGDIVCVVQECGTPMENEGKNCTALPPRDGQCCPDTYICEGDGIPTEKTETSVPSIEYITPYYEVEEIEGSGTEPNEKPITDVPTWLPDVEYSGDNEPITTQTEMSKTPLLAEELTTEPDKSLNTVPHLPDDQFPETEYKATTHLEESKISETTTASHKEAETTTETIITTSTTHASPKVKEDDNIVTTEKTFRRDDEGTLGIKITTQKYQESEVTTFSSESSTESIKTSAEQKYNMTVQEPEHLPEITSELPKESVTEAVTEIFSISPETTLSSEKPLDISTTVSSPSRIPGEGDCLYNGKTFNNNSIVPSENNCQINCLCVSSIVKCENVICSSLPDLIDNCQPIYDSPDSCCPTYVCAPKETVPPQAHNQLAVTESPVLKPSPECGVDLNCQVIEETIPAKECSTGLCSAPPKICEEGKCTLDENVKQGSTSSDSEKPIIEQDCSNKENCLPAQVPDTSISPCEGESCLTPEISQPASQECSDDKCKTETDKVKPSSECSDDLNCQVIEETIPAKECSTGLCSAPSKACDDGKCTLDEKIKQGSTSSDNEEPIIEQDCSDKENCLQAQVPDTSISQCEGESCITPEISKPASQECSDEKCMAETDKVIECKDESCRRKATPTDIKESPCTESSCPVHIPSISQVTTGQATLETETTSSTEEMHITTHEVLPDTQESFTDEPEIHTEYPGIYSTEISGSLENESESKPTEQEKETAPILSENEMELETKMPITSLPETLGPNTEKIPVQPTDASLFPYHRYGNEDKPLPTIDNEKIITTERVTSITTEQSISVTEKHRIPLSEEPTSITTELPTSFLELHTLIPEEESVTKIPEEGFTASRPLETISPEKPAIETQEQPITFTEETGSKASEAETVTEIHATFTVPVSKNTTMFDIEKQTETTKQETSSKSPEVEIEQYPVTIDLQPVTIEPQSVTIEQQPVIIEQQSVTTVQETSSKVPEFDKERQTETTAEESSSKVPEVDTEHQLVTTTEESSSKVSEINIEPQPVTSIEASSDKVPEAVTEQQSVTNANEISTKIPDIDAMRPVTVAEESSSISPESITTAPLSEEPDKATKSSVSVPEHQTALNKIQTPEYITKEPSTLEPQELPVTQKSTVTAEGESINILPEIQFTNPEEQVTKSVEALTTVTQKPESLSSLEPTAVTAIEQSASKSTTEQTLNVPTIADTIITTKDTLDIITQPQEKQSEQHTSESTERLPVITEQSETIATESPSSVKETISTSPEQPESTTQPEQLTSESTEHVPIETEKTESITTESSIFVKEITSKSPEHLDTVTKSQETQTKQPISETTEYQPITEGTGIMITEKLDTVTQSEQFTSKSTEKIPIITEPTEIITTESSTSVKEITSKSPEELNTETKTQETQTQQSISQTTERQPTITEQIIIKTTDKLDAVTQPEQFASESTEHVPTTTQQSQSITTESSTSVKEFPSESPDQLNTATESQEPQSEHPISKTTEPQPIIKEQTVISSTETSFKETSSELPAKEVGSTQISAEEQPSTYGAETSTNAFVHETNLPEQITSQTPEHLVSYTIPQEKIPAVTQVFLPEVTITDKPAVTTIDQESNTLIELQTASPEEETTGKVQVTQEFITEKQQIISNEEPERKAPEVLMTTTENIFTVTAPKIAIKPDENTLVTSVEKTTELPESVTATETLKDITPEPPKTQKQEPDIAVAEMLPTTSLAETTSKTTENGVTVTEIIETIQPDESISKAPQSTKQEEPVTTHDFISTSSSEANVAGVTDQLSSTTVNYVSKPFEESPVAVTEDTSNKETVPIVSEQGPEKEEHIYTTNTEVNSEEPMTATDIQQTQVTNMLTTDANRAVPEDKQQVTEAPEKLSSKVTENLITEEPQTVSEDNLNRKTSEYISAAVTTATSFEENVTKEPELEVSTLPALVHISSKLPEEVANTETQEKISSVEYTSKTPESLISVKDEHTVTYTEASSEVPQQLATSTEVQKEISTSKEPEISVSKEPDVDVEKSSKPPEKFATVSQAQETVENVEPTTKIPEIFITEAKVKPTDLVDETSSKSPETQTPEFKLPEEIVSKEPENIVTSTEKISTIQDLKDIVTTEKQDKFSEASVTVMPVTEGTNSDQLEPHVTVTLEESKPPLPFKETDVPTGPTEKTISETAQTTEEQSSGTVEYTTPVSEKLSSTSEVYLSSKIPEEQVTISWTQETNKIEEKPSETSTIKEIEKQQLTTVGQVPDSESQKTLPSEPSVIQTTESVPLSSELSTLLVETSEETKEQTGVTESQKAIKPEEDLTSKTPQEITPVTDTTQHVTQESEPVTISVTEPQTISFSVETSSKLPEQIATTTETELTVSPEKDTFTQFNVMEETTNKAPELHVTTSEIDKTTLLSVTKEEQAVTFAEETSSKVTEKPFDIPKEPTTSSKELSTETPEEKVSIPSTITAESTTTVGEEVPSSEINNKTPAPTSTPQDVIEHEKYTTVTEINPVQVTTTKTTILETSSTIAKTPELVTVTHEPEIPPKEVTKSVSDETGTTLQEAAVTKPIIESSSEYSVQPEPYPTDILTTIQTHDVVTQIPVVSSSSISASETETTLSGSQGSEKPGQETIQTESTPYIEVSTQYDKYDKLSTETLPHEPTKEPIIGESQKTTEPTELGKPVMEEEQINKLNTEIKSERPSQESPEGQLNADKQADISNVQGHPIIEEHVSTHEPTMPEEELIPVTTSKTTTTTKTDEKPPTLPSLDTFTKPDEILSESHPTSAAPEPTEEIPAPEEPPSVPHAYGQEADYGEDEQPFGPGTCRYGGKVYVSAQQIPRDDPCDFCFCFRSDIICLQQSCPPPIHGCHEEPIQGFCCPRYECPVSMATTLNITTTTTTTTTTLPPHFLSHAYKGAAQKKGCQIKGHVYRVGEVIRASSGPCLHCTCGGDGQMKCDPKACTPEPMLRQMIAAAVSSKRRR